MDDHQTSGTALRRARENANLSMAELAERAGVRKPSLQRWEAGSPPNVTAALRIAAALNTTVDALWGDAALPVDDAGDSDAGPVVVRDGFDQSGEVA